MSARSKKSAAPVAQEPELLAPTPDPVEITFYLRFCKFMYFTQKIDRAVAKVYDLMYAVSEHHGRTILPENVLIFTRKPDTKEEEENESSFIPVTDFTKSLEDFEETSFYYDFDPIAGSLLTIPIASEK